MAYGAILAACRLTTSRHCQTIDGAVVPDFLLYAFLKNAS